MTFTPHHLHLVHQDKLVGVLACICLHSEDGWPSQTKSEYMNYYYYYYYYF
jgi:hypothetical protein